MSAPVSILKRTCALLSIRSTDQKVLFVSVPISPRNKFSSSSTSLTVVDDLKTVPQWPLFEHLKQVASLAGQFARLWGARFPQRSQHVEEGWEGAFFSGVFLGFGPFSSLSFGGFLSCYLDRVDVFLCIFRILEVVSQKGLLLLYSFALSSMIDRISQR